MEWDQRQAREEEVNALNTTTQTGAAGLEQSTQAERIEQYKELLPEDHRPYADKYFLRSQQILEQEGLNPWVRAQVFIRKGPGEVRGIDEAVAVIDKYSDLKEQGGFIKVLPEGSQFSPKDTLMVIEGPAQSLMELETQYLGVLSAETTKANMDVVDVDPADIEARMKAVVEAADGRPVSYFGARHWRFDRDAVITLATHEAGAVSTSTDAGAATFGAEGIGTIPHALENVFAFKYGKDRAVVEATRAFDRYMDPAIPRVALIDYNNREIDDSIQTAIELGGRLSAVRVDTPGENVAQGALRGPEEGTTELWKEVDLPAADTAEAKFWYGTGVTVTGVYALRKALDQAGFEDVRIMLTSGFGDVEKVKAFVEAEKTLGVKLFDGLGVGGVIKPCMAATMDIVGVGEDADSVVPISKVGRYERPNPQLEMVSGFVN